MLKANEEKLFFAGIGIILVFYSFNMTLSTDEINFMGYFKAAAQGYIPYIDFEMNHGQLLFLYFPIYLLTNDLVALRLISTGLTLLTALILYSIGKENKIPTWLSFLAIAFITITIVPAISSTRFMPYAISNFFFALGLYYKDSRLIALTQFGRFIYIIPAILFSTAKEMKYKKTGLAITAAHFLAFIIFPSYFNQIVLHRIWYGDESLIGFDTITIVFGTITTYLFIEYIEKRNIDASMTLSLAGLWWFNFTQSMASPEYYSTLLVPLYYLGTKAKGIFKSSFYILMFLGFIHLIIANGSWFITENQNGVWQPESYRTSVINKINSLNFTGTVCGLETGAIKGHVPKEFSQGQYSLQRKNSTDYWDKVKEKCNYIIATSNRTINTYKAYRIVPSNYEIIAELEAIKIYKVI